MSKSWLVKFPMWLFWQNAAARLLSMSEMVNLDGTPVDTDICEQKHSSGKWCTLEAFLSEHQFRGWRAVSAAGLHGQGSSKRSVFSQTPVSLALDSQNPPFCSIQICTRFPSIACFAHSPADPSSTARGDICRSRRLRGVAATVVYTHIYTYIYMCIYIYIYIYTVVPSKPVSFQKRRYT